MPDEKLTPTAGVTNPSVLISFLACMLGGLVIAVGPLIWAVSTGSGGNFTAKIPSLGKLVATEFFSWGMHNPLLLLVVVAVDALLYGLLLYVIAIVVMHWQQGSRKNT
ncbi:MAG: hypothetical protein NTW74_21680 [Acidobacteria bacterium]|nr:hypothetical protein [Acidobacteriota bacterium]